jgi:alpha-L-fucosidase 2
MRMISFSIALILFSIITVAKAAPNGGDPFIAGNDVAWTTLGTNENDSMPIGNGDLAANVWTEQNGDLVLLPAKSDAWTELGILTKLGRIRIKLTPNPFAGASNFTQALKLEDGAIEIRNGGNSMRIWLDANHLVLHVEFHLEHPATLQTDLELWRTTTHPFSEPSPERGGLFEFGGHNVPMDFEADTVLPAGSNSLTWCHFNRASVYPLVLRQAHLALARLAGRLDCGLQTSRPISNNGGGSRGGWQDHEIEGDTRIQSQRCGH